MSRPGGAFEASKGIVEIVGVGSARVIAERQALVKPDGTLEVLVSTVVLHPR